MVVWGWGGGGGGGRGLEPETVYYGDDALSTKPVKLIWTLLIPATRGHHSIQGVSYDYRLQCHLIAGISVVQISIT